MTDGFKGYVTDAGLSPPTIENLGDVVGIAQKKSLNELVNFPQVDANFFGNKRYPQAAPDAVAGRREVPVTRREPIFEAGRRQS